MPRQKRTQAAPEPAAETLPELTHKQLGFVRGILDGLNASDAYRAAYDAAAMSPECLWAEASRLRHDHKVSTWIIAARQACLSKTVVTLDSHISELTSLRELAKATGNLGAAVLAETNVGKACGLYTDRIEDVTKRTEDVKSLVSRIAQMDPAAGLALARALGIATPDVVVDGTDGHHSETTDHVTH